MSNDWNGFSLSNLTGTPGMVLVLFIALALGIVGFTFAFKGHVVL